jgi:class 3 adenylate cyclase
MTLAQGIAKQTIFVVDDTPADIDAIEAALSGTYLVTTAVDGETALKAIEKKKPDLILLGTMMHGLDGYEVCRRLKANVDTRDIPVVFLTAKSAADDEARGLEIGAVDYITKPVSIPILLARIRTHLALHTAVCQLEELNQSLELHVAEGVARIERLDQLRRFFSPAVADILLTGQADVYLKPRRREIVVVFLDLRGFTAFTESYGPDDVMRALNEFYSAMGEIIIAYDGTVERFTGDGMMIFFNDPIEIPDPALRAVNMAVDMQVRMAEIDRDWQQRGHDLRMGIGIAQGEATIGAIGFEGRHDYGAIGSVVNLAARLCGQAKGGQVLCSGAVEANLHGKLKATPIHGLVLKGFAQPVKAFEISKD